MNVYNVSVNANLVQDHPIRIVLLVIVDFS
jgi:hypothetical protein